MNLQRKKEKQTKKTLSKIGTFPLYDSLYKVQQQCQNQQVELPCM